ncbi:class I SAM-dependent methyltransferase [Chitinophagaceae bacterium LWZ2-11]
MDTQQAYNIWAAQYDTNNNKTRDLEGLALKISLTNIHFDDCLEVGCGTGKNTVWFADKTKHVTSVDFSEEMLAIAKSKITTGNVEFKQVDINKDWTFRTQQYDLVSFSLVLEHIENLDHIFMEVAASLKPGGHVYIGELHPFKQYTGSKARFDTEHGTQVVPCFTHNASDFIQSAKKFGLSIVDLNEYFDDDNRNEIPRILTIILKKIS